VATAYIIDVTNRDGVQAPRICLSKFQKTILDLYLDELGVFQSEFGFPITSHEINYLNANLELVERGIITNTRLSGWLRAIPGDVELAFSNCPALKHVNLSISTSDIMIEHKFGGKFSHDDVIATMIEAVKLAKERGAISVGVNAEDASRSDMDYLIEFAGAAESAGADRLRYCDTVGCETPFSIYERITNLASQLKMGIEVHCHNDIGMAVANSVAGAKAAIDSGSDVYVNTCINGIGERAGNADTISVILALKHGCGLEHYGVDDRIKLDVAYRLCKYVSYALGIPIPINQPAMGANAFAHESGIHAAGALENRKTYELYNLEDVGRGEPEIISTGQEITVGEYSGIKGLRSVYFRMGIEFENDNHASEILDLVRYASLHNQKSLLDVELRFIAQYPDITRQILTVEPISAYL